MSRTRVGVLISGRGSNLQALLDAQATGQAPFEIALVLSNDPAAGGLERALRAGVETAIVDHKPFGKNRAARSRTTASGSSRWRGSCACSRPASWGAGPDA